MSDAVVLQLPCLSRLRELPIKVVFLREEEVELLLRPTDSSLTAGIECLFTDVSKSLLSHGVTLDGDGGELRQVDEVRGLFMLHRCTPEQVEDRFEALLGGEATYIDVLEGVWERGEEADGVHVEDGPEEVECSQTLRRLEDIPDRCRREVGEGEVLEVDK